MPTNENDAILTSLTRRRVLQGAGWTLRRRGICRRGGGGVGTFTGQGRLSNSR